MVQRFLSRSPRSDFFFPKKMSDRTEGYFAFFRASEQRTAKISVTVRFLEWQSGRANYALKLNSKN